MNAPFTLLMNFFVSVAKLRKVTISFDMSVSPSLRIEQMGSHWTDFHEIRYLSIFQNFLEEIQVWLKSAKNNWYFTLKAVYIDIAVFSLEWEISGECPRN
jgi:hypothetical protein